MALKYRLGLPVFPEESDCLHCGRKSDIFGDHATSACHTSGGIIRRHDLLRDATYTTPCTPTLTSPHLRPSKEERDLLDDPSRPEGERKKQKKAEDGRKGKKEKTGS